MTHPFQAGRRAGTCPRGSATRDKETPGAPKTAPTGIGAPVFIGKEVSHVEGIGKTLGRNVVPGRPHRGSGNIAQACARGAVDRYGSTAPQAPRGCRNRSLARLAHP